MGNPGSPHNGFFAQMMIIGNDGNLGLRSRLGSVTSCALRTKMLAALVMVRVMIRQLWWRGV